MSRLQLLHLSFTVHNLLGQSKWNVLIWSSALNVIHTCFPTNYRNQTKFREHDLRIITLTNLQASRVAFGYSKGSLPCILILREEVALVVIAQPAEIGICFKTQATFSKIWLHFWFGKSENALFRTTELIPSTIHKSLPLTQFSQLMDLHPNCAQDQGESNICHLI